MAVVLALALFAQVEVLAEQAGVDPVNLQGAVNTTGLEPQEYLFMTGELSRPRATAPVSAVWDRLAHVRVERSLAHRRLPRRRLAIPAVRPGRRTAAASTRAMPGRPRASSRSPSLRRCRPRPAGGSGLCARGRLGLR